MPEIQRERNYLSLRRGLNTVSNEITFPDEFTSDELNYTIEPDGSRKRRRGLKEESGGTPIEIQTGGTYWQSTKDDYSRSFKWPAAGGIPDNDLIVHQFGKSLWFTKDDETLSANVITREIARSDLVSTGDFASDTNWTKGTGWTISGGTATHAAGSASSLSQADTGIINTYWYRVTFDVSGRSAGTVTPSIKGRSGTAVSANGTTITQDIQASTGGTSTAISFACSSDFDGSLDNVTVKYLEPLKVRLPLTEKSFWADPQSTTITAAMIAAEPCSFSVHRGMLVITHKYLKPMYIEALPEPSPSSNQIDDDLEVRLYINRINLRIRDFEGIEDGVTNTQKLTGTITADHNYNLRNRGWMTDDITAFKTAKGFHPTKNMQWWKGYTRAATYTPNDGSSPVAAADGFGDYVFSSYKLDTEVFGDASAPQGALVISPLDTTVGFGTSGYTYSANTAEIPLIADPSAADSSTFYWTNSSGVKSNVDSGKGSATTVYITLEAAHNSTTALVKDSTFIIDEQNWTYISNDDGNDVEWTGLNRIFSVRDRFDSNNSYTGAGGATLVAPTVADTANNTAAIANIITDGAGASTANDLIQVAVYQIATDIADWQPGDYSRDGFFQSQSISNSSGDVSDTAPAVTAAFAGRVWYAGMSHSDYFLFSSSSKTRDFR